MRSLKHLLEFVWMIRRKLRMSVVTAVAHSLTSPILNANHMQQLVRCNVQTSVSFTSVPGSAPAQSYGINPHTFPQSQRYKY